MLKRIPLLVILCSPCFGAWHYRMQWSLPSPAATETNFTVKLRFSDTTLKTAGNGGAIQNTVTFDNITVPADLILTTDSTCATQTYSNWGWPQYSASAGTGLIDLLIPSYSTSLTVYGCYGQPSTNTYQGGSRGGEYDSNTKLVLHLADNAGNMTIYDASATAQNFTASQNTSLSSVAGPFGANSLALNFDSNLSATAPNNTALSPSLSDATFEVWVQRNTASNNAFSEWLDTTGNGTGRGFTWSWGNQGIAAGEVRFGTDGDIGYNFENLVQTATNSVWQSWAVVLHYVSGASFTSALSYLNAGTGQSLSTVWRVDTASTTGETINTLRPNGPLNSYLAEMRICACQRSANWLADENTNQSSVPVAGSITNLIPATPGRVVFN